MPLRFSRRGITSIGKIPNHALYYVQLGVVKVQFQVIGCRVESNRQKGSGIAWNKGSLEEEGRIAELVDKKSTKTQGD